MPDQTWTPEEEKILGPFFTNLYDDVFGLRLPQEVAGALFSRYSRSSKSLRRTFLDEFMGNPDLVSHEPMATSQEQGGQEAALKKAREFYDRVLVGYGDDSVAQLGGAHMACENISNIAANILEDSRIGIAPLEKSTRYVRFDKKDTQGEYLFYKEPRILTSAYSEEYQETMRFLFGVYSNQRDSVIESVKTRLPIEKTEFKHPRTGEPLDYRQASKESDLKRWADSAYRSTVRAHACDVLRGLLPMATKTNVGFFGVGQAYEYLLTKCYSNPLTEIKNLAGGMHRELNQLIPSFVKRAKPSSYLVETERNVKDLTGHGFRESPVKGQETVHLVDYDPQAEEKILAAILFPGTHQSFSEIRAYIKGLSFDSRQDILSKYLKHRRNRRDKPGRALENVQYTFEVLCNIGSYRDLHRHRILTQERQAFTVEHGYDTPSEIVEMGIRSEFDACMDRAESLYRKMVRDLPNEAQYVVPFAYRVRWYMTVNLRELYHIVELRTMPQGHPDYRLVAQEIWKQVERVHPALAAYASFVDRNTYRLGRLQSELRTEYKKTALSNPPPPR